MISASPSSLEKSLVFQHLPVYTMKYSPSLLPSENFKHSLGPDPILGIWGFISEYDCE